MKISLPTITLLALGAISVAMTSRVRAEDALLIEPTWKAGKKYTCEHTQNVVIAIGEGDQAVENPVNVSISFEAGVSAHGAEGGKAVSFKATKVKMSMSMFGQAAEFDSENQEKQSADLAAMLGGVLDTKDLKVIFDKDDKFLKFEGEQKAQDAGGAPGLAPMQFGNNEIRQLLAYCVRSFPDNPIKKGDKWTSEESVNLNLGAAEVKMNMTAMDPNDKGQPVIAYESKIDAKFPEGGVSAGGKGEGSMQGEMIYDPEKAIIVAHTAGIAMKVNLSGLELPIRQSANTTVVKVEDIAK